MEKSILRLISFAILLSGHMAVCAKVPEKTNTFINSVENLSSISPNDANSASILTTKIINCFTGSSTSQGTDINNSELYFLGLNNAKFSSRTYSRLLRKYIFDDKTLFSKYKIHDTEIIKAPDRKDTPRFYYTYVETSINYNGRVYKYWQRFSEDHEKSLVRDKGINQIITQEQPFDKKIIVDGDKNTMTAKQLLDLAAEYYTRKDYTSAYDTYKTITTKYDSNAEGWYRLAIMTRMKKGCKYSDYKSVAKSYMKKARDRASGELLRKAEDVLYYWEHPNFY